MNPARSPIVTSILPSCWASASTSSTTLGSVTTVRITSTSFMTGAGLKKCSPTTRPGLLVATEMSVTDSDDVLVARIVRASQTRSSSAKIARLSSNRSGTASTTRSQSLTSSIDVVNVTRSNIARCSSADSLPRFTARSVECSRWPRPRTSASSVGSTPTTVKPLRAKTSTMPAPIVPSPMTPTFANVRAIESAASCGRAVAFRPRRCLASAVSQTPEATGRLACTACGSSSRGAASTTSAG